MKDFFQRYIDSWTFNGWRIHDITLGIVLVVGILLCLFVLFKRRRLSSFLMVVVIYGGIGSLVMIVFGLAGRSFPIHSVSAVYTDSSQHIAVQMVEGYENNGTREGITHIISHRQITAIDLATGKTHWTKSASSKDTIIGPFMDGLLVHHRNGELGELSLLDIQTGKEKLSKKAFTEQHKPLIDVLDHNAYNLIALQNQLYVEGVDGRYYRYDGEHLQEDPTADKVLTSRFFIESQISHYFASHDDSSVWEKEEQIRAYATHVLEQPVLQAITNLELYILDVDMEAEMALVSYRKTKRESADWVVVLYDVKRQRIMWETNIGRVNSEQEIPGIRVLDSYYAIQAGDTFILLDKDSGEKQLSYHLRWNRKVDDGS